MMKELSRVWLSLRGPAMWFAICLVLNLAMVGSKACYPANPKTVSVMLLLAIAFAAIVAVAGYVRQLIRGKTLDSLTIRVVICDCCHRVKPPDGEAGCECGGTFDDFDKWMWIDEERDRIAGNIDDCRRSNSVAILGDGGDTIRNS